MSELSFDMITRAAKGVMKKLECSKQEAEGIVWDDTEVCNEHDTAIWDSRHDACSFAVELALGALENSGHREVITLVPLTDELVKEVALVEWEFDREVRRDFSRTDLRFSDLPGWAQQTHYARVHRGLQTAMKLADPTPAPLWKEENLEIVNGTLCERGVHELEYPAGAAYGPMSYSDAEPILDLSKIPGWPGEQS